VSDGTGRVRDELRQLGISDDDLIISTNVPVRLDGFPRSNEREPDDPGVAVYWKKRKDPIHKVMAIDIYDRVADNLGAVAACLWAIRSMERHGGKPIMERAFTGFLQLPAPNTWRAVFGWDEEQRVNQLDVKLRYNQLSHERHPDKGGTDAKMAELNWAKTEAERELA
jgi:hypothetical protein